MKNKINESNVSITEEKQYCLKMFKNIIDEFNKNMNTEYYFMCLNCGKEYYFKTYIRNPQYQALSMERPCPDCETLNQYQMVKIK